MDKFFDEIEAIRLAEAPSKAIKQRIANKANELSLAGVLAARLSVANEALFKLTGLVYEADTDGGFANVDRVTGRILIPLPWGPKGQKRYHLRRSEADICRAILLERQWTAEKMSAADRSRYRPQLFTYNEYDKDWFANLDAYHTFEEAQKWLKPGPLTLQEWRYATEKIREKRSGK